MYVELNSQDLTVSETRSRSPGVGDRPRAATFGSCAERKLAGASAVASSAPDLTQGTTEATGPQEKVRSILTSAT